MKLFRKVVSLKNIYVNESHWLYTLQTYTVCKSAVEMNHMFMEEPLNLIGFTDFLYKYKLTSLNLFSSLKKASAV